MRKLLLLITLLAACRDSSAPCNPLTSDPAARCWWTPSAGQYTLTDSLTSSGWVTTNGGGSLAISRNPAVVYGDYGAWDFRLGAAERIGTWGINADSLQRILQMDLSPSSILLSLSANDSWIAMPFDEWDSARNGLPSPGYMIATTSDHIIVASLNQPFNITRAYGFRRQ